MSNYRKNELLKIGCEEVGCSICDTLYIRSKGILDMFYCSAECYWKKNN